MNEHSAAMLQQAWTKSVDEVVAAAGLDTGKDLTAAAVSIAFLIFGFTRLWHVFNMRSPDSALLINEISNTPFVWIAISVGIALLLAAVYVPLLAGALSIQAPDIYGWLLLVQLMKIGRIGWEAD